MPHERETLLNSLPQLRDFCYPHHDAIGQHGPILVRKFRAGWGQTRMNPSRKIFEARKRETAALGAGEKLVLGHPLAATVGDSARCMQNLEKVLFTGPKTSDTVTFICD